MPPSPDVQAAFATPWNGVDAGRHEALLQDPEFLAIAPEAARHLDGMVASVATRS